MRQQIRDIWHENTKVAENYVFMTILQVLNLCFYLLIYPYLIRTLGAESYGLYAYAVALVAIFITFVSFGFDLPAAKRVAVHVTDKQMLSTILSEVTQAKLVLELIAVALFALLLLFVPMLSANRVLFSIAFLQTLTNIVFPQWYFQGVQRMRVVTYVQVICKTISLPFIFLLIRCPEDIELYMLIATLTMLVGGLSAWLIIRFRDGLNVRLQPWSQIRQLIRDALPFFLSNAASIVKEQGVVLIIGQLVGMTEVAIYDLANKIIIIPRVILCKLNDAIYPKMMTDGNASYRRKVLLSEIGLGLLTIAAIAAFGYWAVLILGGKAMIAAYPISIILSVTIGTWLIVGALHYFYIIPSGKTYYITVNQVIAMVSTFVFAGVGLSLVQSAWVLAAALAIAGLVETGYSTYVVRKKLHL